MTTLYGFWSYSREGTSGIAALHREMQDSLSGNGPAPGGAKIFFDTGIPPGQDWARGIVEAASRSLVFFWVQNPRWPARSLCRFEFDMFEDRVAGIAREFSTAAYPLDPDRLWHSLVVPIRWAAIAEDGWDTIGTDPAATVRLRRLWARTNVLEALDFAKKDARATDAGGDYSQLCRLVSARISDNLLNAIPSLGRRITPLLEYLTGNQDDFVARWCVEFDRRDILRLERQGNAPAPRAAGRSIVAWKRRQLNWPYLRQVEIPATDGQPAFWVTEEPISEKLLVGVDTTPLIWRVDPAGNALWSAATAASIVDELADVNLRPPTVVQARTLLDLQSRDRLALAQLGVHFRVMNFWHLPRSEGPIAPARATGETHLPLLLVSNDD